MTTERIKARGRLYQVAWFGESASWKFAIQYEDEFGYWHDITGASSEPSPSIKGSPEIHRAAERLNLDLEVE